MLYENKNISASVKTSNQQISYQIQLAPDNELQTIGQPEHKLKHSAQLKNSTDQPATKKYTFEIQPKNILLSEYLASTNYSIDIAIDMASQIIEYMQSAHIAGYICQNLSPDHIFYNEDDAAISIIPVLIQREKTNHPPYFSSKEEILYSSPEETGQTKQSIDWRSNYYAFGILLYELIYKEKLIDIEKSTSEDIINYHLSATYNKEIKKTNVKFFYVNQIIARLLNNDKDDRYQFFDEILSDLEAIKNLKKKYIIPHRLNTYIFYNDTYINALNLFDCKQPSNTQNVIVKGYSGTGKSQLINQISKKCLITGSTLVKGFHEEKTKTTPYSGIYQALIELHSYVEKTNNKNILKEIDENKKINIQSINKIIPGIDPKPELNSSENNGNSDKADESIIEYLTILSSFNMKIVISLDDMQWADEKTISLISHINKQKINNLRFLLTYSLDINSSINPVYPTTSADKKTTTLNIKGLNYDDCKKYIAYVSDDKCSKSLINAIYFKTSGNPLFIKQMLLSIDFRQDNIKLELFKLLSESTKNDTGEVSFYIEQNLKSLKTEHITLLQYMSCYGKPVTEELLSKICKINIEKIKKILASKELSSFITPKLKKHAFSHNQFSEIAYNAIPDRKRDEIHLNIAKYLEELDLDFNSEDIADQYNSIINFTTKDIINKKAEINLLSSKKLIQNTSYTAAYEASDIAYESSQSKKINLDDSVIQEIHYYYAYSSYLTGKHEAAANHISQLINESVNAKDTITYYALYKDVILNYGKDYNKPVETGLKILRAMDIALNENNIMIDKYLSDLSTEKSIDTFMLKEDKNGPTKDIMKLLLDIWEAAYFAGNIEIMDKTIKKLVSLTMRKGICSESSFGFVMYAMTLTKENKHKTAYKLGILALKIIDRLDDKIMFPKVTNLFCNYTAFYGESFGDISNKYNNSCNAAKETGDYLFGVWAALFSIWTKFLSHAPLKDTLKVSENHYKFVLKTNDEKMIRMHQILINLIRTYTENNNPSQPKNNKKPFSISDSLQHFSDNKFLPGPGWYAILYSQFYYLMGDYKLALKLIDQYLVVRDIDIIMFPITQIHFYEALSIIGLIKNKTRDYDTQEQKRLESCMDQLSLLSEINPENFICQEYIINAEISAYINKEPEAKEKYLTAIEVLKLHGTDLELALLYELYADYMISNDCNSEIQATIKESIFYYRRWGAELKVKQLNQKHEKALFADNIPVENISKAIPIFDSTRIIEAFRDISKELNLDTLLEKMMHIMIKASGANKAYYIETSINYQSIICSFSFNKVSIRPKTQVHSKTEYIFSPALNYTATTGNYILLQNACRFGQFTDYPYIKDNAIKSLLCLPIKNTNEVTHVLYLENNLNSNVFNKDTIDILNTLLSQISISIENARAYSELNIRHKKIEQHNKELLANINAISSSHSHANIGTWEWDLQTGGLLWSEHIPALFGYPDGELETSYENFINAVHPDDRELVERSIKSCFSGGDYYVEHRILKPDGSLCWVLETGNVSRNEAGEPVKMHGVIQDISRSKETEINNQNLNKQLAQKQKMESLGQLTGGIAHDFNNILASIIGYTELSRMMLNSNNTENLSSYLDQIDIAGQRAKQLVSQMMAFGRKSNTDSQSINIEPILKESVKLLSSTIPSSIDIQLHIGNAIKNAIIDPIKIQQVIINLCVNSRDAIEEVGSIKVELSNTVIDNEICSACSQEYTGDFVELSITDTGPGISDVIIEKIFDPFFTTKELGKGTGMGLSVVHGIVHENNGHIKIISTGQGTCIRILLPAADNEIITEANSKDLNIIESQIKANIVLVDDETSILGIMSELLTSSGATVTSFNKSPAALEHIKENIADIDLIITDMTMPDITGYSLATETFKLRPEIAIILCTGHSDVIDEESARNSGIKHFLRKPYHNSELVNAVHDLLDVKLIEH